jgi:hypothetical protein
MDGLSTSRALGLMHHRRSASLRSSDPANLADWLRLAEHVPEPNALNYRHIAHILMMKISGLRPTSLTSATSPTSEIQIGESNHMRATNNKDPKMETLIKTNSNELAYYQDPPHMLVRSG